MASRDNAGKEPKRVANGHVRKHRRRRGSGTGDRV
jgi:hypothetical protein